MKSLLIAIALLSTQLSFAQMGVKTQHSAYLLFGMHPRTQFHIISGSSRLTASIPFVYEGGYNWDRQCKDRWMLRLAGVVHFNMGNDFYGIVDDKKTLPWYNLIYPVRPRGITNANFGADLLIGYDLFRTDRKRLTLMTGPSLQIYTSAADLESTLYWYSDSTGMLIKYQYESDYRHDPTTTFRLSLPQLEWSFLLEYQHSFKKLGTLGFGIKYHIGTKRLERSTYVTYPSMPAITSTGTFSYNRNYGGIYASYFFGSKKKGK